MLSPMFGRQHRPKSFELPLRYYNPEEEERRKRRIHIDIQRHRRPNQGLRVMTLAILLSFVIWLLI